MIRTACLVALLVVFVILITPFIVFCLLAGLRDPLVVVGQWAVRLGRRLLGIDVDVSGLDRLDSRTAYVYMPNHGSFLDGPLVMAAIPGAARAILKKSILRIPIIGMAMRFVGFVPVDRRGREGGKKSIARAAALMRNKRYSYLVFPEGTRTRDGSLGPFRRGGFFLAIETGAPIVPITIEGTFKLMPKGQWYSRKGRVWISFHEPIPVSGWTPETMGGLIERVREAILERTEASR